MIDINILKQIALGAAVEAPANTKMRTSFHCPKCYGSHFGTYEDNVYCHDEYGKGCIWSGPKAGHFFIDISARDFAEELLRCYKQLHLNGHPGYDQFDIDAETLYGH